MQRTLKTSCTISSQSWRLAFFSPKMGDTLCALGASTLCTGPQSPVRQA